MATEQKSEKGDPKIESLLDRLVSRIPYSDGSTRRRLLAGVIVGVAAWAVANPNQTLATLLTSDQLGRVFQYTLPSIVIGITVYLLGTLVEIVGNVSLVRAAANAWRTVNEFWQVGPPAPPAWFKTGFKSLLVGWMAISLALRASPTFVASVTRFLSDNLDVMGEWVVIVVVPGVMGRMILSLLKAARRFTQQRRIVPTSWRSRKLVTPTNGIWFVVWAPTAVVLATIRGLMGRTDHTLGLAGRLSPGGLAALETAPGPIAAGLEGPLGDHGELALHYLLEHYKEPSNRKWAGRQIGRVRDVAAIVSAVVISLTTIVGTAAVQGITREPSEEIRRNAARDEAWRVTIARANLIAQRINPLLDSDPDLKKFPGFSDAIVAHNALVSRFNREPRDVWSVESLASALSANETTLGSLQMRAGGLSVPPSRIDDEAKPVRAALKAWAEAESALTAFRRQQFLSQIFAAIAIQLTLFLYLILFVTLRSAVESMIEALAIERAELAVGVAPQEAATVASATVLRVASSGAASDRPAS